MPKRCRHSRASQTETVGRHSCGQPFGDRRPEVDHAPPHERPKSPTPSPRSQTRLQTGGAIRLRVVQASRRSSVSHHNRTRVSRSSGAVIPCFGRDACLPNGAPLPHQPVAPPSGCRPAAGSGWLPMRTRRATGFPARVMRDVPPPPPAEPAVTDASWPGASRRWPMRGLLAVPSPCSTCRTALATRGRSAHLRRYRPAPTRRQTWAWLSHACVRRSCHKPGCTKVNIVRGVAGAIRYLPSASPALLRA